jgi:ABC-2 type transport system ATP-binding protein
MNGTMNGGMNGGMNGAMNGVAIRTDDLRKAFAVRKSSVVAVDGVNLEVNRGEIFGFLGPNGAGKTTVLRLLATLLPIDDGRATVAGYDVSTQAAEVRKHVGYVSQLGGADDEATGYQDMVLQGRLYGMTQTAADARAHELANSLQLSEFAGRKIKTYSGGQKRRLDVASGIMHKPDVLFLDEPTTGLDPQNRANLWEQIRRLRDDGTTVFLTTHYLEEADALSDRVAILDHGKVVAEGTPRELKARIAGDAVVIKPKLDGEAGEQALQRVRDYLVTPAFVREARGEGDAVRLYVDDGGKALPQLIALLEARHVEIESVWLSQPSLDDVFLEKTGRSLRDAGETQGAGS